MSHSRQVVLLSISTVLITLFTVLSVESRNLQKLDLVDSTSQKSSPVYSAPITPTGSIRQQHSSVILNRHHQNNQYNSSHHHEPHRQNYDRIHVIVTSPIKSNQFSVCQLHNSKCNEASFNHSALSEFQKKLDYTSADLKQLIKTYWEEFRALSLDLVLVAKNNTLSRIAYTRDPYFLANERLFNAIHSNLNNYDMVPSQDYETLPTMLLSSIQNLPIPNMNIEIANYFHRLYSIILKRLLDSRLQSVGEVDLECLSSNLKSQQELEKVISELFGDINEHENAQSYSKSNRQQLSQEQTRITQSIKQSLDFTKTLLSSLGLANEMFYNLTHGASDWMPHSSCHQALARMTLCPQCYNPQPKKGSSIGVDIIQPPCEDYCLNVVRGCMNDIYELHRFWVDHVNALARFKTNMIQMNNIENVMSNLDERLINFMTKLTQQYNTSGTSSTFSLPSTTSNSDQQQSTALKVSNSIYFEKSK